MKDDERRNRYEEAMGQAALTRQTDAHAATKCSCGVRHGKTMHGDHHKTSCPLFVRKVRVV